MKTNIQDLAEIQESKPKKLTHSIQFETATDCFLWLEENEIYNPVTLTIHLED
jgi:hypothetical protein